MMNGEYTISFPAGHFDREFELPYKGYARNVHVKAADGRSWTLYFTDLSRLRQDLDDAKGRGECYFAEPGMIVLSEVTIEIIRNAIEGLWDDGFFKTLAHPVEIS
jgi:hypothetical protein